MKFKLKSESNFREAPSLEQQYNSIMRNFDFDKVLEYMNWDKSRRSYDDDGKCIAKSNWKMYTSQGYRVPDLKELKDLASQLMLDIIRKYNDNRPFYFIATGPFKVTCRYGILELNCVIESWSCD